MNPPTNTRASFTIISTNWRLARYAGVESGLLEHRMHDQEERLSRDYDYIPENHRLAIAFDALSGAHSSLALLNRYQSRLHHEYHRLLKTLAQMQLAQARTPKSPNAANPTNEHPADAQVAPVRAANPQSPTPNPPFML